MRVGVVYIKINESVRAKVHGCLQKTSLSLQIADAVVLTDGDGCLNLIVKNTT